MHTIRTTLEYATIHLELPRPASRIFLMDGREVKSVELLRHVLPTPCSDNAP